MKKDKLKKETEPDSSAINILDSGTIIKGDLESAGRLRIDGKIIGTITAKEKIILGQTGYIEGEISCKSAEISGKIQGKIRVKELLALQASAQIEGDVYTRKLAIEPGAIFNANCKMSDNPLTSFNKEHSLHQKNDETTTAEEKQTQKPKQGFPA
ncbi:MAG: polymer-forming cytoskeletal protein [Bacteroidales bacterium]